MTLRLDGEATSIVPVDEDGCFRIAPPPAGLFSLTCEDGRRAPGGHPDLPPVTGLRWPCGSGAARAAYSTVRRIPAGAHEGSGVASPLVETKLYIPRSAAAWWHGRG